MKIERRDIEEVPAVYPRLKQHSTLKFIVLFASPNSGIVLTEGESKHYVAGYLSTNFNEETFHEYHGVITLSN